ncbi:nitrogenase component 1 [Methanocalculus sp.]|uniref:nitrogenase component 1 n=1 Tax=Methanocalculus sp. TaxID=2004547 RepID=UPI00271C6D45|nr:nitrogenase component 1 [Methanocalculus sp.]MDO8840832.1 nitrogenase component 1 [Methanocalculus sp.]
MISNRSPIDISRSEGCTLTGVLSVTGFLDDAVTVIHGPSGCTHHNASLLYASLAEIDSFDLPRFISSNVLEEDVIFGGEDALLHAIDAAEALDPALICVVSTCIADTIGDDTAAVCRKPRGIPVVYIPGSGFLGGGFSEGIKNALLSLIPLSPSMASSPEEGVMIVGEKNLEYEADENFDEVSRLISLLGLHTGLRFVRRMPAPACQRISVAPLAVLRDPSLEPVGSALRERFGTSIISGFPIGPDGTLNFLRSLGESGGIDSLPAIRDEEGHLEDLYDTFSDLSGLSVTFDPKSANPGSADVAESMIQVLGMKKTASGHLLPLPYDPPVGTAGTKRMLHAWRRSLSRA